MSEVAQPVCSEKDESLCKKWVEDIELSDDMSFSSVRQRRKVESQQVG